MVDNSVEEQQLLDYWRYAHNGESYGPVSGDEINDMLRDKQLPPTILVWREGMVEFVQVTEFAGLIRGVKVSPRMILDPQARRQRQMVSNARQNSVTMFVIFLLGLMGLLVQIAIILRGNAETTGGGCFVMVGVLGGIYAAIYLPLRWKILMTLQQNFRVMGLVGGFGLLALLPLSIAGSVLAVVAGP